MTRREWLAAAGLLAAGLATSCTAPTIGPSTTAKAWKQLEHRLGGAVIRPGDPRYADLATPRNLRFAASMPEAVVLCNGVEDITAAISWARETNTAFAIRGGGHNYAAGSSSRGMVLSTRPMTAAAVHGGTLRAQAGVRNADLAQLLPRGGAGRLLLPGGNCPNVGVAGLTLGGGIGPNAPWAGLTADRLRRATMVTADGGVVTASATENAELFWGLRGGAGGNFGVVSDLEYELVEVPVTRATTGLLTVDGSDAALATAMEFQRLRAGAERTATGSLNLRHADGDVAARLRVQILADEKPARDLLAGLLGIPGVKAEITERPWWDAYAWYVTKPSPAYSFWDRSRYADRFLSADALAGAIAVLRRFPAGDDPERYGAMGLLGWVGGAVDDVPAGATAYVHRGARILVEMSSGWSTPKDPVWPATPIPPDIVDWETELWEALQPHTNGHSYQNFPDPELTDWAGAYYGDNLIRLEQLKSAWDPDGVFGYPQGVPLAR